MPCSVCRTLAALFLAALFLPPLSSRAEEPMATQPEECLFFGDPSYHGVDYDPEQNLFLMANEGGVHAFDARSGTQRWQHAFASRDSEVRWGGKHVLGREGCNLFLLDRATGREVWTCRDSQYGKAYEASLALEEGRVMVSYAQVPERYDPKFKPQFTHVLYNINPPRTRVFTQLKDANLAGFLADGRSAVFFRQKGETSPALSLWDNHGLKEYLLLDTESGGMTEGHVIPDSDRCLGASVSPSGLLAMPLCSPEKGPIGLKIFDVRTGGLVRDLGERPEIFVSPNWTEDEKRIYSVIWDDREKTICVRDAQTGAVLQTLSRPGHTLVKLRMQQPAEGPDMILSRDEDRNYWFWPPVADATPVKVFDGRRIAPGSMGLQLHNSGHVTAHRQIPGVDLLVAYRLEDMQKAGEWRATLNYLHQGDLFNRNLTHFISRVTTQSEDGKTPKKSVEVCVKGGEVPVFSGEGAPCALSPDGRFFVLQTGDKTAVLQDLEQKRTVCSFTNKSQYGFEIQAAFSEDGRRVAVNAYPNLEVVELGGEFARRKMNPADGQQGFQIVRGLWNYGHGQCLCFSPDGTRLLSGAYSGRAFLHDADTGALVHTLVEPSRFLDEQAPMRQGFLNSLAETAKDWAGMVTDGFKRNTPVYVSFADQGNRLVTHAAGQIIRVWDSRTGKLVNTIETGLPERRDRNGAIHNRIVLSDNGDYAFAHNGDNFVPASLWSLADGVRIRRYKFPDNGPFSIAVSDDGKSVFVLDKGDLSRWPGRAKDAGTNR